MHTPSPGSRMADDKKAGLSEVSVARPTVRPRADAASSQADAALAGIRAKIHPRSVSGPFARIRILMVVLTQLVFYGLPWLQWNGRQAVLFDLAARKFYLFGMVLWPQDVIYLALLLVISAFALFLFTAMAGRLFCGYACPQTVYTEIFMWIEARLEGDRLARIRLDGQPWNARKLRVKATKHLLWIVVALWTGYTFIGYFAPIREVGAHALAFTLGPWQWFWMLFYAFATWGNAGFMRESVCKYMCPYARFQSVMVDNDTFVVTYDHVRGEPRTGRSRKLDHKKAGLGDCVDCSLCVQVCPTGIDIRDGLQYMCIGCGACADVCDTVMGKMGYEPGLIRYTSGNAITEHLTQSQVRRRMLRPRVLAYSALLGVIAIGFVYSLAVRATLRMDVIRDRGTLGREVPGGLVENVYQLQLINASESPLTLRLSAAGVAGLTLSSPDGQGDSAHAVASDQGARGVPAGSAEALQLQLEGASNRLLPVTVRAPAQGLTPGLHDIRFEAHGVRPATGRTDVVTEPSSFYVPR